MLNPLGYSNIGVVWSSSFIQVSVEWWYPSCFGNLNLISCELLTADLQLSRAQFSSLTILFAHVGLLLVMHLIAMLNKPCVQLYCWPMHDWAQFLDAKLVTLEWTLWNSLVPALDLWYGLLCLWIPREIILFLANWSTEKLENSSVVLLSFLVV